MDAERWQRAERLFEEALQLADAERSAFLRHACGDDAALHDLPHTKHDHHAAGDNHQEFFSRNRVHQR